MVTLDLFVESTVTAFQFDRTSREMKIEVSCEWEGKTRKAIVVTGIVDFVLDDFREYNIIDRVNLLPQKTRWMGTPNLSLACSS